MAGFVSARCRKNILQDLWNLPPPLQIRQKSGHYSNESGGDYFKLSIKGHVLFNQYLSVFQILEA